MQQVPATAPSTPPRWTAPAFVVFAAVLAFVAAVATTRVLGDPDTYLHVAIGQWILAHHAVPGTDPFSYTIAGKPWVAHEWLSGVLLALAYQGLGWSGVIVLTGVATAAAAAALAHHVARWLDQPGAFVLWLTGFACVAPSLLARPHLFAIAVLTFWCLGLLNAIERRRAPSLWLLPLMTLWANLHGSFVLGLALLAPLACEAWLATPTLGLRLRLMRGWLIFGVLAVAATLITPHGVEGLLFPFRLLSMASTGYITEWQPTSFAHIEPAECALLALIYVLGTRNVRLSLPRMLLLIALIHLALAHGRHLMVAGMVGALILAEPCGRAGGRTQAASIRFGQARPWLVAGALCVLAAAGLRLAHPVARAADEVTPAAALDHVPAALLGTPMYNDYDFGGYLIFRHLHPFIDGRADLYGDDYMRDYAAASRPDRAAFERIVNRYGVRWLLLEAHAPLITLLDTSPEWKRIYGDATAVVYVRDQAQP